MPRVKNIIPTRNSMVGETCFDNPCASQDDESAQSPIRKSRRSSGPVFSFRRKLLSNFPTKCITLGSLTIKCDLLSNFDKNEHDLSLVGTIEYLIFKLEVATKRRNNKKLLDITIPDKEIQKLELHTILRFSKWILDSLDEESGEMTIQIVVPKNQFPIVRSKRIIEIFTQQSLGLSDLRQSENSKNEKLTFFREVKNYKINTECYHSIDVNVELLIPTLRPYQLESVKWMIHRERTEEMPQYINWTNSVIQEVKLHDSLVYFNQYSEVLALNIFDEIRPLPKGGILADEMGLGKTVSIIALILSHSRNVQEELDNDEYLLPLETQDYKVRPFYKKFKRSSDEIASRNLESSLDAKEKLLVFDGKEGKPKKGMMKRALTEWYENMLAEYQTTSTPKRRKVERNTVKCVCGGANHNKSYVQCPECNNYQHVDCVGYTLNYHYFCPSCWTKQKLVKSEATLIVAPTSICHQWVDEMNKHVKEGPFKDNITMYTGVRDGFVQPSVLASKHIVITTYDVLKADLNHAVPNDSTRTLRNEERFLRQSSPLPQIQWWRLCMDEAQMVESHASMVNQMIKLLHAVNLWAVTGTPIQKSLQDLYFLIDFLTFQPFTDRVLWQNYLYLPYVNGNKVPLLSVMGSVFWRSSKTDVSSDLMLPEQTIQKHLLKFTAIEESFYMREHLSSSKKFAEVIAKTGYGVDVAIDSLDKSSLNKLLAPLLNLRQACSHPQVVHGNKITTQTGSLTQKELLDYMCSKTKLECEDAARRYISALNGLAGIHCIRQEWPEAVDQYRTVLQFNAEYREKINIDSLQRIHTCTNLSQVLQEHSEESKIAPTLMDDNLNLIASDLEEKYIKKAVEELQTSKQAAHELSEEVTTLTNQFDTGPCVWWQSVLNILSYKDMEDDLLMKINEAFTTDETFKKPQKLFATQVRTIHGVQIFLRNWLSELDEKRDKALKSLETVGALTIADLTNNAIDCHLRTWSTVSSTKTCPLCVSEAILLDYECSLFSISRKKLKREYEKVIDGAQTKGSWKPHNGEVILRCILSAVTRGKGVLANNEKYCSTDGRLHMRLLGTTKKEFKHLRVVWMSLNHQVQAHDEVSMSKLRLRLRYPGEELPPKKTSDLSLKQGNKIESIYIIEQYEVNNQQLVLLGDIRVSLSEFRKKFGTLMYLKNLGEKGNTAPDPCPICKTDLKRGWCVLQCGHSYCVECIHNLISRSTVVFIQCPVCRERTHRRNLSFVHQDEEKKNIDTIVIGEHSTKVESIVRCVIELMQQDPKVKILIFSSWAMVLTILGVALNENKISYRRMPGHRYQEHLRQFKDPNENVTVLLLPISWGSKGLNLVEATHVFLVEPIMNPAEELQAIGRVHRIGQTKETVVHRFLINGTIEEKIHLAVSEAQDKWSDKKVTVNDLSELFVLKGNANELGYS